MSDIYKIYVEFERQLSEDEEMARGKYPGLPLEKALVQQIVSELQEACDNGMAGFFQVTAIHLGDEVHE